MTKQPSTPYPAEKAVQLPVSDEVTKEVEREKAEVQEVAGRHKNDGALNQKGRQ